MCRIFVTLLLVTSEKDVYFLIRLELRTLYLHASFIEETR